MDLNERLDVWRKGKALVQIKINNPGFFNSWRAFKYTKKGKLAGNCKRWDDFCNFYNDMFDTYSNGKRLCRIDKSKPFCKENCIWMADDELGILKQQSLRLTFDNKTLTIKEWAIVANVTPSSIKNRYYKHKDWPIKDIIYGKRKSKNFVARDYKTSSMTIRQKASKMISAYNFKDKKYNLGTCDIDIDWMIDNIILQPCYYCGDTHRIGCDRIDNTKAHTKDNVLPCCYDCNCARNNNFTVEEMKIIGKAIGNIKQNRTNNNDKTQ